jgi:sugar/nucleoside kinase (ribokinase family)
MSSAAGHEVTVIGNAIVDEVHRGGRVEEQLGGNGFNVAVALGSSGVRTCLVARFAADDAGRAFVESLRLRGVTIVRQPAIVSTDFSHRTRTSLRVQFDTAPERRLLSGGDRYARDLACRGGQLLPVRKP